MTQQQIQKQTRIGKLHKLLDSKRVPGRLEKLAIERQINDLLHGEERGLFWDEDEAVRRVGFHKLCCHWKGELAGKPIIPEPWQEELWIAPLYAWKLEDGNRRFRTSFIELARKNGKSTEDAINGLGGLVLDSEGGPEVYTLATKKDQARIVWKDAMNMVRQSSALRSRISIGALALTCAFNQGTFQPLSTDLNGLDGLNPHVGIIDELHAHKSHYVHDKILTGMGARLQPLLHEITTAGRYDPESIGWAQHDYSRMVLEGAIQCDTHHSLIFCADEGDDWQDPATWWKANPNMGVSIYQKFLKDMCDLAIARPSSLNSFLMHHLNLWQQEMKRWIDIKKWNACAAEFTEDDLYGKNCFIALDLSTTTDLTAMALIFPPQPGLEKYRIIMRFFMPDNDIIERERLDRVPYTKWHRDGWIDFTPGEIVDYQRLIAQIMEDYSKFNVIEVPYDPYNATSVVTALQNEGLIPVVIQQSFKLLSPASKELERLYLSGGLEHDGNPVLRWMASSVALREDHEGNIKPDKPARGKGSRIDGISAIVTGLSRAITAENKAFEYTGM